MKGEDFLRELNDLEESIIEEARNPRRKKRINGNVIKFIGLAACITVFTGAVIIRSIGVKTNKEVYPAEKQTPAETETIKIQEETELPSSKGYEKGKKIVWQEYDLNDDGVNDTITVDIPADYESKKTTCTISDGVSQDMIYQKAFSSDISDWGELHMYKQGEELYFIEYQPILRQGVGNYEYRVFMIDQHSTQIEVDRNNIFFNLGDIENHAENIDKMAEFYYDINRYLLDAVLLVSIVDDEIQYSEENHRIAKPEQYQFLNEYDFLSEEGKLDDNSDSNEENISAVQKNIAQKIELYFNYRVEYQNYIESNVSLVLEENTLTPYGASFEIVNTSNIDGYSEESFFIEKLEKDNWKTCDYIDNDVEFNDAVWQIKNYTSYSFFADWSNIYGELENGYYRLVKNFSVSENTYVETVCYFEILSEADAATAANVTVSKNEQ